MRRLVCVLLLAGCSMARPLDHSFFRASGSSGLNEEQLATILDSPLMLRLPARVGVVSLREPFRPEAPESIADEVGPPQVLASAMEHAGNVSLAVQVAPEVPAGDGLEGLRGLAARYRVPYLLTISQRFDSHTEANAWSPMWLTVVGALVTPSITIAGDGLVEASLLDVRTGTVLFTVRQPMHVESAHRPLGAGAAFDAQRRQAAEASVKELAAGVVERWQQLVHAAQPEGHVALGP